MVIGKDLVALGLKPTEWSREAIDHSNDHALAGEALTAYLDTMRPPPRRPLLAQPVPFHENISADTAIGQDTIDYIRQPVRRLMRAPTVGGGAIMPDAGPARPPGLIPVGGIVVTRNATHPGLPSANICCSVMLTNRDHADPKNSY